MESKHPNNMKIAKRTQEGRSIKIFSVSIRVHPWPTNTHPPNPWYPESFLVEARRRSVAGGVVPGPPEQPAKGADRNTAEISPESGFRLVGGQG